MCKKTLFLFLAAVVVLGMVGNASALITEQRDSVDFGEKWEGDTDPPTGYTPPDVTRLLDTSTDGDIFTMYCEGDVEGPNSNKIGSYNSISWPSSALDANGWSLEISLKIGPNHPNFPDKPHFQFRLQDDSGQFNIYRFFPDKVELYPAVMVSETDMTDVFHTFRVAQEAGSDIFEVYLDNEKVGEHVPYGTSVNASLWWGSGSTALYGTTYIDYIRLDYSGGYRQKIYGAINPSPAVGADYVSLNPTLTWLPGDFAVSHDVYFGTVEADVNTGSGGTYIDNRPGASYSPATLIPDTNYYWRIDEVNVTTTTGNLWSFTTAPAIATQSYPADYQQNVPPAASLTWTAGVSAASHDVYFGNTYPPAFIQNQPGTSYTPVFLDSDTMYFWRIDEVNGATTWEGDPWRFTVLDSFKSDIAGENMIATAMSEYVSGDGGINVAQRVVDGSGLDETGLLHDTLLAGIGGTQWMSQGSTSDQNETNPAGTHGPAWIAFEFDKVYTLEEMWLWNANHSWEPAVIDRGFKTTQIHYSTDGITWYQLLDGADPNFVFARGLYADDYAHDDYSNSPGGGNNEVDFGGVEAKYVVLTCLENWSAGAQAFYVLAEVRFYTSVPYASRPDPAHKIEGVPTDKELTWYPGAGSTSHSLYFGNTYPPPFIQNQPGITYSPTLALGSTYYWRVDEVNASGTVTGKIWEFVINNYMLVDDMEAYNSNPIYNTWNDGYVNYSGSWIDTTTLVTYNGDIAMDFAYDNRASYGGYSEVDASTSAIGAPTDWTQQGIEALTLHFYGDPGNDANETMYVALKDGDSARGNFEVRYGDKSDEDMNNIKAKAWQEWNIDLGEFADAGINVANVERLYIGFDDSNAANRGSTAGGSGTVYFDDISIYLSRCIQSRGPAGDITGPDGLPDCVVDKWDAKQLAANWLVTDSYVTTVNPDTDGLVGYWRLDKGEGTTALDYSGYGYDGTLLDGPSWTSDAVYLNALDFDGADDHVFIDDGFGLAPWEFSIESFSISMWIKSDNTDFSVMLVNGTSAPPTSAKRYEVSKAAGIGIFFAIDDDDTKTQLQVSNTNFITGSWVHIVAIRDRSLDEIRLYADGGLEGNLEDITGDISSPDEGLYFASIWDADTYYYDGKLDDVRIYNRVLTDQQISDIANKAEPTAFVYQPLRTPSELSATEAEGDRIINFMDYSVMANDWQASGTWPR